jgi:hypothetical protein
MGTGHNGGGNAPKLTPEMSDRVIEALRESGGIKAVAAKNLRVSRITLYRFIKANPDLLEAINEIDEEMKDLVEGKMLTAIRNDDPQMIRFFLERRARDRGYGIRQEVTGPNGGPVEIETRTIDVSKLTFEQQKALLAAVVHNETDED